MLAVKLLARTKHTKQELQWRQNSRSAIIPEHAYFKELQQASQILSIDDTSQNPGTNRVAYKLNLLGL